MVPPLSSCTDQETRVSLRFWIFAVNRWFWPTRMLGFMGEMLIEGLFGSPLMPPLPLPPQPTSANALRVARKNRRVLRIDRLREVTIPGLHREGESLGDGRRYPPCVLRAGSVRPGKANHSPPRMTPL